MITSPMKTVIIKKDANNWNVWFPVNKATDKLYFFTSVLLPLCLELNSLLHYILKYPMSNFKKMNTTLWNSNFTKLNSI